MGTPTVWQQKLLLILYTLIACAGFDDHALSPLEMFIHHHVIVHTAITTVRLGPLCTRKTLYMPSANSRSTGLNLTATVLVHCAHDC